MLDKTKKHPRLYVNAALATGENLDVSEPHFHYLVNVLRFKSAEHVLLFNADSGEWLAEFVLVGKKNAQFKLVRKTRDPILTLEMHLFFAPLKRTAQDFVIEKGTELGVTHFHPVITEYTQVHHFNVEKYQQTAIEAAEQCERFDVPLISAPLPLAKAVETYKGQILWADEAGARLKAETKLSAGKAILIGPEGGFSDKERHFLLNQPPILPCHLGPRILRAETAALAMLAWLGFRRVE